MFFNRRALACTKRPMAKRFEPEKVVDLSIDYYGVLSLEKGCLPPYGVRENNEKISEILEKGWRKAARRAHPNNGGSHDEFILVMRAHEFLSDPLYRAYIDSDGKERPKQLGEGVHEVDIDSVGTYVEGSLADTVGHGLFLKMRKKARDIGLSPAYRPQSQLEAYEWDWIIVGTGKDKIGRQKDPDKVTLAIVEDPEDVFRLTSGDAVENSLPFKIYICIPRVSPRVRRTKDQLVKMDDGSEVVWRGSLKSAVYDDYELLSTTTVEEAEDYLFGGALEDDLQLFKDGTLVKRKHEESVAERQIGWRNKEEVKRLDTEVYKEILKRKTWVLTPDPYAADFLDRFPVGEENENAAQ
jgi:hypothetical protein